MDAFAQRRERFMELMGSRSIAIVQAASIVYRSRDSRYPFRQDSDFRYLTNFPEPDAIAVLAPGRPEGAFVLFCHPRDPEHEQWEGRRVGLEGARTCYGADQAFPIEAFEAHLSELLAGRGRLYHGFGRRNETDERIWRAVHSLRAQAKNGIQAPVEHVLIDHPLHAMRLRKEPGEIDHLREAAAITSRAHCRAMQAARAGMMEFELAADVQHEFLLAGAQPAYIPIVASGPNACILHYRDNESAIGENALILLDAGCELNGYATDVTRTFPSNGIFAEGQRMIYEIVLAAQTAAIDACIAGNHWNDPHDAAVCAVTAGLQEIGLLRGDLDELIGSEAYRRFFMHKTGHWLGMDVHDVGEYAEGGRWRPLECGMVLTVEPGIYIPPQAPGVPDLFHGIGIRIEDDVVVGSDRAEVLTEAAPRTIPEIEALMASSRMT